MLAQKGRHLFCRKLMMRHAGNAASIIAPIGAITHRALLTLMSMQKKIKAHASLETRTWVLYGQVRAEGGLPTLGVTEFATHAPALALVLGLLGTLRRIKGRHGIGHVSQT